MDEQGLTYFLSLAPDFKTRKLLVEVQAVAASFELVLDYLLNPETWLQFPADERRSAGWLEGLPESRWEMEKPGGIPTRF